MEGTLSGFPFWNGVQTVWRARGCETSYLILQRHMLVESSNYNNAKAAIQQQNYFKTTQSSLTLTTSSSVHRYWHLVPPDVASTVACDAGLRIQHRHQFIQFDIYDSQISGSAICTVEGLCNLFSFRTALSSQSPSSFS